MPPRDHLMKVRTPPVFFFYKEGIPPILSLRSTNAMDLIPSLDNAIAAPMPAGPAPMMTTLKCFVEFILSYVSRTYFVAATISLPGPRLVILLSGMPQCSEMISATCI